MPSDTALLLIDFINPFEFEGSDALLRSALPAALRVRDLCVRARAASIPLIYVNDNFDCWHLGFRELVQRFGAPHARGRPIVELLGPDFERDHFILKPMHSGFFRTPLEVLLGRIGARRLVLTGIAGESCVIFTAHDAYMRDFELAVPRDCIASEQTSCNEAALRHMARVLKADVRPSAEIDLHAAHPVGPRLAGSALARRVRRGLDDGSLPGERAEEGPHPAAPDAGEPEPGIRRPEGRRDLLRRDTQR